MLIKRELILFKIESTYNTDAVPVIGTDAVYVENPSWSNEGARMIDRNNVGSGALDTSRKIYGGSLQTVAFDVEIKGSGAAGTAPELGAMLRACGLSETVVASTSVTYAPVDTGLESGTIYYYQDGKRKILTGCRGNVSFNLTAGEVGKASFTFTGHVGTESDQTFPSASFDSTLPAAIVGLTSFALGGVSLEFTTLEFGLNNTIATPPSAVASDGFGQVRITGRDLAGTIDPEDALVATNDHLAKWRAGTTQALDTGVIGSAGNQFRLQGTNAAYRDVGPGDRDGVRTLAIGFGVDDFSLAFT